MNFAARSVWSTTGSVPLVNDGEIMARLLGIVSPNDSPFEQRQHLRSWARARGVEPGSESLRRLLRAEIDKAGLRRVYDLEREVWGIARDIEREGIPVDLSAWSELVIVRRRSMERAQRTLGTEFGLSKPHDGGACAAVGRRQGLDLDKADRVELSRYPDNPYAQALTQYRVEHAFVHNLGPKVLEAARADGRARTKLDPLGAINGRFTSSEPNLLGIEKRSEVRRCIRAVRGRKLVSADFAQIDLKVLAVLSQDARLLRYFREGADLHTRTAAIILGRPEGDIGDTERSAGKAVGFAIVYGAGADGIRKYAAKNFGLQLSLDEARELRRKYLAHYQGVAAWQERRNRESGECRSLWGRRCVVSSDELPTKLNLPVSMTSADIFKLALVYASRMLTHFDAQIILPVHDEIFVEVAETDADEVSCLLKEVMEMAMTEILGDAVPALVEVQIGESWGG